MKPITRERVAWLVACVMLAMLAFRINGSLGQREDDYQFVRTLIDIHRQVARGYADPVDEAKLRQGAIDGMLSQLDPYTTYVPPAKQADFDQQIDGRFKGIGVQLEAAENGEIRVISPIDNSPALEAGVRAGDVLLKVNGEDVKGVKIDDVRGKISKGPLEVRLRVRRETGEEVDLGPMTRREINLPTVKGFRRLPGGGTDWDWYVSRQPKVGYIRVTQFTANTMTDVRAELDKLLADGMKGLILDLRFNPGGLLEDATEVVDMFIDKGKILVTRGRNSPEKVYVAKEKKDKLPDFPLVVLVNEHSASAAEIVAGSLQENGRATVVGERTFGKGSVQQVIPLGDREGKLKMTIAYYYLPSGRLVHRKKDATEWGVEPNIKVAMDTEQQRRLVLAQADGEIIGRSAAKPATAPTTGSTTAPATAPATSPASLPALPGPPTTGPAATSPAAITPAAGTRPSPDEPLKSIDPQLDAALQVIVGKIVLARADATVPADAGKPLATMPTTVQAPPVATTGPATGPTAKPK